MQVTHELSHPELHDAIVRIRNANEKIVELPSGIVLLHVRWDEDEPKAIEFAPNPGKMLMCIGVATASQPGQYTVRMYGIASPILDSNERDASLWNPTDPDKQSFVPIDPFIFSQIMPAVADVRRGPGHQGDAPPLDLVLVCTKPPQMMSIETVPSFSVEEFSGEVPSRHKLQCMQAAPIDIPISGAWMPALGDPKPFSLLVAPAEGDEMTYEAIDFFAFNGRDQFYLVGVWNEFEQTKIFEGRTDVDEFGPAIDEDRFSTFRMGRFSRKHPLILSFEGKMVSATQPMPRLVAVLRAKPAV